MSLYRRGDTWHYDFQLAGHRYRGTTRCIKKGDAQKYLERLRRDLALGAFNALQEQTLKDVSVEWFKAKVAGTKAEATVGFRLNIMLRHFDGDALISTIGAAEVQAAISRRRVETTRQGKLPSNSTVNRDLIDTTLRPILRFAGRNLELKVREIPWSDLRLKEPKGRTRTFSGDEIDAWRASMPEWHRPLFDFINRYGVRLTEAFFPLDAIDVVGGRVALRARKNGGTHYLPLLPDDLSNMKARMGRARDADLSTVWFRQKPDGKLQAITPRGHQAASQAALKAAKIVDARPVHDRRHHAATTALKASGNLAVVKQLLGHESITSTARYAHVSDADVLAALGHKSPHTEAEVVKIISENKSERAG